MTDDSKDADALAEWAKLDKAISEPFKKKLAERLLNPYAPASRLSGQKKPLQNQTEKRYRLVYDVVDRQLIVTVVAVGERNAVCKAAASS